MRNDLLLYFDDTGNRQNDQNVLWSRRDKMDCFGLGGLLVETKNVDSILKEHRAFCDRWEIDHPLHSHSIRGQRKYFSWLRHCPDKAEFFLSLNEFLLQLPLLVIGTVIHRPGYFSRYLNKYKAKIWTLDKTATVILVERSTKFAMRNGMKLRIFFEKSGNKEDTAIKRYITSLKNEGMPFSVSSSEKYEGLTARDLNSTIIDSGDTRTKASPLMQLADLYLYPIAKAAYDPDYPPYIALRKAELVVDDKLPPNLRTTQGVKYSCFDFTNGAKSKGLGSPSPILRPA